MKVKNAHEEHVLECYDKNKIYLYLVNQLKSVNTIDEDKIWILSQTEYEDQCIRTVLVNDHRIVFYG